MIEFYSEIMKIIKKYEGILFGISNINFSKYNSEYKCALVLAVPHAELLDIKNYNEQRFEDLIDEARNTIDMLLAEITNILDIHKIKYYIPPVAQLSEETLVAPFSFKYACVNAGIGWIGKNDVLITEKYGPRVRLSAVLIDYELTQSNPIKQSQCPSDCSICIENCPYNALTNNVWKVDSKREELIDYKLCNQKRTLFIKKHNRKNSCGLCMISCPIGIHNS